MNTPGPWIVLDQEELRDVKTGDQHFGICQLVEDEEHSEIGVKICNLVCQATPDEIRSNARLIVAAPELLMALDKMLQAFDVGQRAGPASAIGIARRVIEEVRGDL